MSGEISLSQKLEKFVKKEVKQLRAGWSAMHPKRDGLISLSGSGLNDAEITFANVKGMMPELISQMKEHISHSPIREFVTLHSRKLIDGSVHKPSYKFVFCYYEDEHKDEHVDLQGKINTLKNCGYVSWCSHKSGYRHRMTDKFVYFLQRAA